MGALSNVEVVRRSHELFEQGRVDEWVELFTEDVEVPALTLIGSESLYRGRDGLRRWHEEVSASETSIKAYTDEFIEVDDQRVVVVGRVVVEEGDGRGYGSVAGWVYTVVGGCISRVEIHSHPRAAMRAAGLVDDRAGAT